MKNIVCFHLFNDYSGSPKVLKTVVEGLLEKGYKVDLVTSRGGVLDELKGHNGLRMRQYSYKFSRNSIARLLRYAWVQLQVFFIALGYIFKRDTVIYINTILPVAAALGGRIAFKRVVYHYHENAKAKSTAYRILARIMQLIASEIICVSEYQSSFLRRKKKVYVIPNALQHKFTANIVPDSRRAFAQKRILMLGSLKGYKGTREFIELAARMNNYRFELVINDSQENIDNYIKQHSFEPTENLTIYPQQHDVTGFYNRASIVLNLSNREQFVETFGLTALEAMTAGLPVIVPTVGGISEMVTDGANGYKIDVQDIGEIEEKIKVILKNEDFFLSLSKNALECSQGFTADRMVESIERLILKQ